MRLTFSERNPIIIGAVGTVLTVAALIVALQYKALISWNQQQEYSAYFAEIGGLGSGAVVEVSGARVGNVTGITLDGARVRVEFTIDKDVRLGDRSEASIKTATLLGEKFVDVSSRGTGELSGPIPVDRTRAPYNLTDALSDLTSTVEEINADQLSQSLKTLAETFKDTPPDVQVAVQGLGRFSESLSKRDNQLRDLLENANKATRVLADRSQQVVSLISDTNALLAHLRTESDSLDGLSGNLSSLSKGLSGFVADNREQIGPALDKLNKILTIVDNRKGNLQEAIRRLNGVALALGESVSSGPFFNAYLANVLPGQFIQPFVDAAFSDLGLDPSTLLPSQLTDPQTGQPGTPAMPVPYPRTGQGGEPRLTVPDAITGNPGDQSCGPPGLPLPGPGCYPFREPPPAPPPGGPPPGPPAPTTPEATPTQATPTPLPVYQPAPGELPAPEGDNP